MIGFTPKVCFGAVLCAVFDSYLGEGNAFGALCCLARYDVLVTLKCKCNPISPV
jgi:hypothetical protein